MTSEVKFVEEIVNVGIAALDNISCDEELLLSNINGDCKERDENEELFNFTEVAPLNTSNGELECERRSSTILSTETEPDVTETSEYGMGAGGEECGSWNVILFNTRVREDEIYEWMEVDGGGRGREIERTDSDTLPSFTIIALGEVEVSKEEAIVTREGVSADAEEIVRGDESSQWMERVSDASLSTLTHPTCEARDTA